MDQFGTEADPIAFVRTNRDIFNKENYDDPVNKEFVEKVPWAAPFMETNTQGQLVFSDEKRAEFAAELAERATSGAISQQEADTIAAYYLAFYEGRGYAPNGGAPLLPEDSQFYGQFR